MKEFTSLHKMMLGMMIAVLAAFSSPSLAQKKDAPTNQREWELSFGLEGMSFYGFDDNSGLNKNPFNLGRFNIGPTATFGTWINPYWGVRLKGSGYWGKALKGINPSGNSIRYYNFQVQPGINLMNVINKKDVGNIYDIVPHVDLGFMRNCTDNMNYMLFGFGCNGTFRISSHIKAHLDLGIDFSSKNSKDIKYTDENKYNIGEQIKGMKQFARLYGDLGLTFVLGNWQGKKRNTDPYYIYNVGGAKDYTKIFYTNQEDRGFARILPKDKAIPEGMVLINRGHIRMGITNTVEDEMWNPSSPVRDVSVDDFVMDVTEVTNEQYRTFVNDIVRSVIHQRLRDPYFGGDSLAVVNSLYLTNPVTGERSLDGKQLNFVWEEYDYISASQKEFRMDAENSRQIMISKDTAFVDYDGTIVKQRITRPRTGPYDFLNTYVVNVLPDTTVWINDFPKADNSMYTRYYYSHPDYAKYPVVGVTWEQAQAYCAWRTERLRQQMGGDLGNEQPFRLPTEAEWEYAARGASQNEFPWLQDIAGNGRQAVLANFQNEEGNYTKDGNLITSVVGTYKANTFGLYDMAGNVAEWTSTAFTETGVEDMNNINPHHTYNAAEADPKKYTRKTVRGGSWKDPESHIKSAWRTYEYQNQPRSYIGFRCVRSLATKPTEKAIIINH